MKRRLDFAKLSPGGNTTIIISTPVERSEQAKLANVLMNPLHLGAEQVGYLEPATKKSAVARLQMMGGEFCGNATRSLAYLLARWGWPGVKMTGDVAMVPLEVSGVDRVLKAWVNADLGEWTGAGVNMPFRPSLDSVHETMVAKNMRGTLVELDGISHAIVDVSQVEGKTLPGLEDTDQIDRFKTLAKTILNDLRWLNEAAAGVLFCKFKGENEVEMFPVVWVRDTKTLYAETACGSGSVAIALAVAKREMSREAMINVRQPSGSIIGATADIKDGRFRSATIGGEIELIAEGSVYV